MKDDTTDMHIHVYTENFFFTNYYYYYYYFILTQAHFYCF